MLLLGAAHSSHTRSGACSPSWFSFITISLSVSDLPPGLSASRPICLSLCHSSPSRSPSLPPFLHRSFSLCPFYTCPINNHLSSSFLFPFLSSYPLCMIVTSSSSLSPFSSSFSPFPLLLLRLLLLPLQPFSFSSPFFPFNSSPSPAHTVSPFLSASPFPPPPPSPSPFSPLLLLTPFLIFFLLLLLHSFFSHLILPPLPLQPLSSSCR